MTNQEVAENFRLVDEYNTIEFLEFYHISWMVDGTILTTYGPCVAINNGEVLFQLSEPVTCSAVAGVASLKAYQVAKSLTEEAEFLGFDYSDSATGKVRVRL